MNIFNVVVAESNEGLFLMWFVTNIRSQTQPTPGCESFDNMGKLTEALGRMFLMIPEDQEYAIAMSTPQTERDLEVVAETFSTCGVRPVTMLVLSSLLRSINQTLKNVPLT